MSIPVATPPAAAAGRSPASRAAVVGAGLAGLTCARALVARGFAVTVFDKGRSLGGRLAVRRVAPHTFDLGAQYFTARVPRFAREVEAWLADGACQPWATRIVAIVADGSRRPAEPTARFVGTPDMNAIAHHVGRGLDIRASHRVDQITRDDTDGASRLVLAGTTAAGATLPPASGATTGAPFGAFHHVVLCMPPSQAEVPVAALAPDLAAKLRDVAPLEPCSRSGSGGACPITRSPGSASMPRSSDAPTILARSSRGSHATPPSPGARRASAGRSTRPRSGRVPGSIAPKPTSPPPCSPRSRACSRSSGCPPLTVLRRWTLARAASQLAPGPLRATAVPLSVGGDWAAGGRIESAYLSGLALADEIASR